MGKAGRHYHWKHGWIPLTQAALAYKEGDGPKPGPRTKKLPLTVDQKRAVLNERRKERGEAPLLPPKRTRKPPNWVPPKDNVSVAKPVTDAERRKIIADELAKSPATIRAEEKKAAEAARAKKTKNGFTKSDGQIFRKNYADMSPAEKIRAAEIMYGKDSEKAKMVRAVVSAKAVDDGVTVSKNSAGVFHVQDENGKVLYRTTDPIRALDWLTKNGMPSSTAKDYVRTASSAADKRRDTYRHVDTVDGVDFVTYKTAEMDPLMGDHGNPHQFTHEQQQILADAYNEVHAEFPGMQPVQIVGVDGKTEAFGITSWDGRRISISSDLFDPKKVAYAKSQWHGHGAVAGGFVDDPEAFARAVMTHELGHALQMQNAEVKRKGVALAEERVTADVIPLDVQDFSQASQPPAIFKRWEVDTLNGQSVYATGNQFEWFAEAFADGWFNGDRATSRGKRVLDMVREAYGKEKVAA